MVIIEAEAGSGGAKMMRNCCCCGSRLQQSGRVPERCAVAALSLLIRQIGLQDKTRQDKPLEPAEPVCALEIALLIWIFQGG